MLLGLAVDIDGSVEIVPDLELGYDLGCSHGRDLDDHIAVPQ